MNILNPFIQFNSKSFKVINSNDEANSIFSHDVKDSNLMDLIDVNNEKMKSILNETNNSELYSTTLKSKKEKVHFTVNKISDEIINISFYKKIRLTDSTIEGKDNSQEHLGNLLFKEIFEHSPLGLILVNSDRTMIRSNEYLFDRFKLHVEDVYGKRFGNVFHCSVVNEKGKVCGTEEACKECKFRNGVESIIEHGNMLEGVELSHSFVLNGRKTVKWFNISASPITMNNRTYALLTFIDITERVIKEQELKSLGMIDDLTKLYNRATFYDLVNESLNKSEPSEVLTIGMMDIDNFKYINDTYGHHQGDVVLEKLSKAIKSTIRETDYVGRYGGEEFVIFLQGSSIERSEVVVRRIQKAFGDITANDPHGSITFSCGLAEIGHENLESYTLDEIIDVADKMMYKVKSSGKNGVKSTLCK